MRTGFLYFCAAAILAAYVFCQADEPEEPVATSDRPVECPDGHRELRDVPIRYGMVSNDDQRRQDLADLKYVLGGCIMGKDSPKTAVICGKCRFRYRGDGVWYKSSTDVDLFGKPFSKVLLDFLKRFQPEDAVHYDQTVEDKRLVRQGVQFKCSQDRKSLDVEVAHLMQQHDIRRRTSRYDHEVFYGSDALSGVYQVWVLTDQGNQLLDLNISSKGRKKATAPLIRDLASPDQQVRDKAAAELRATFQTTPESKWTPTLQEIKKGQTKKEILEALRPFNVTTGFGFGTGQAYSESFRLDDEWVLICWFANDGDMLIDRKLSPSVRHIWTTPPEKYSGKWVVYFVNGQKSHEINYKDGQYLGKFTSYRSNGSKCYVQHYTEKGADGADTGYHPSGKVAYQGQYRAGKQVGTWTWFDEAGNVTSTKSYGEP